MSIYLSIYLYIYISIYRFGGDVTTRVDRARKRPQAPKGPYIDIDIVRGWERPPCVLVPPAVLCPPGGPPPYGVVPHGSSHRHAHGSCIGAGTTADVVRSRNSH